MKKIISAVILISSSLTTNVSALEALKASVNQSYLEELRKTFFDNETKLAEFASVIKKAQDAKVKVTDELMQALFTPFNTSAAQALRNKYGLTVNFHSAVSEYEKADFYSTLLLETANIEKLNRTGKKLDLNITYYRDQNRTEKLSKLFSKEVADHYKLASEDANVGGRARAFDLSIMNAEPIAQILQIPSATYPTLELIDKESSSTIKKDWANGTIITAKVGEESITEKGQDYYLKQVQEGNVFARIQTGQYFQYIPVKEDENFKSFKNTIKTIGGSVKVIRGQVRNFSNDGFALASLTIPKVALDLDKTKAPMAILSDNVWLSGEAAFNQDHVKEYFISNPSDAVAAIVATDAKLKMAIAEKEVREVAANQKKIDADKKDALDGLLKSLKGPSTNCPPKAPVSAAHR
ncbi:MAG: hypothetical protein JWQ35_1185 [Bacteriovoracaceae bacterium]|nr:hypothetical protein [Bacteriovoracaceae bacterium]